VTLRRAAVAHGSIAWEEIRARVEAAGRAMEGAVSPRSEESRSVLEKRARLLSRPLAPEDQGEVLNLVSFRVQEETYAVDCRWVFEVFRPMEIAPLPGGVDALMGIAVWRGDLLPVLDLRALLGPGSSAGSDAPTLVVVGKGRPTLCLRADGPGGVITGPAASIRPIPEGLAGRDYLRGVMGDVILVLDMERVLRAAELPQGRD
jgi:purine-binding chemotaxis protein CheW